MTSLLANWINPVKLKLSLDWNHRNILLRSAPSVKQAYDIRMTGGEDTKQMSYGWLRFRPTWLQFLNTPKWFLFFLSQYFFTQSIVVNGIYPGSISTIEKRFGYSRLVPLRTLNRSRFDHVRPVYTTCSRGGFTPLCVTRQWILHLFSFV